MTEILTVFFVALASLAVALFEIWLSGRYR